MTINFTQETKIQSQSMIKDFFKSFILALGNFFLVLILVEIGGIYKNNLFPLPEIIAVFMASVFLIGTPAYLAAFRHSWPSKNKKINLLFAFFVVSIIGFVMHVGLKYSSGGSW